MKQFDVHIEISVTSPEYGDVDEALLCRAVRAAMEVARDERDMDCLANTPVIVGIRVTSNEEMQALNLQFRGVDRPTDVLSFSYLQEEDESVLQAPELDEGMSLGEIVLAYPIVVAQALDLEHSVRKELAWLTIHGVLQLLGYTHYTEPEAEHMETLEQAALDRLGMRDA